MGTFYHCGPAVSAVSAGGEYYYGCWPRQGRGCAVLYHVMAAAKAAGPARIASDYILSYFLHISAVLNKFLKIS